MAVQTHTLDNGLTIALEHQPWNPGVAMQLLVPVGALGDNEHVGSANMLEYWLWKGAGSRDARALADAFDDLGVRKGSSAGLEHTTFVAQFLASKTDQVLGLYADVLMRPHLEDATLEPIRPLILQDLASIDDSPPKKMNTAFRRAVFVSPHGNNPSGQASTISNLSAGALRAEFQRYQASGAIVALVGGIDMEQAVALVGKHFGAWQGRPSLQPVLELSVPHILHIEQETSQTQIGIIYPEIGYDHPNFYASRLAAQVLSGGMSSRLFTEVRQKRGLVYSVHAGINAIKGFHYLSAYAGTMPDRVNTTLEVMQAELVGIANGVTADELERARLGLKTSLIMAEESTRSRAASIARDLYMVGRVRTLEEIQAGLDAVSLERINQHLAQNPYHNPWICTLGPTLEVTA